MAGPRILIVDDDASMARALEKGLDGRGYSCVTAGSAEQAVERLAKEPIAVAITDLRMGGADGHELCRRVSESYPDTPVILMTAFGDLDAAVETMRAGAFDFITKPLELEVLVLALERALRHRDLHMEVQRLQREAAPTTAFEELVGESMPMRRLFDLIDQVADTDVTVLVSGETGTGKELVARAVHRKSARRERPFMAINCAAVPEALLEDELFGHLHGAYTGSRGPRPGLLQSAHGGTLFLDEVGDMPLGLQPKLLRVLQDHRFRPVGSDREIEVDVRVVAATHHDLEAAVAAGRFREDLLYRLSVVQLELPPLRERGNDILLLAQHFLELAPQRESGRVTGISVAAARLMLAYEWPGNVRELQNAMERSVVLARYSEVTPEELPPKLSQLQLTAKASAEAGEVEMIPLETVERRHILGVLERVKGKRARAAEILQIDRKTLYRKLERWGFGEEHGEVDPG